MLWQCCSVFRQVSLPEKSYFLFLRRSGTMLFTGAHVIFQLLVFIDIDDKTKIDPQQRLGTMSSQAKSSSTDYDFTYISPDHKTRCQ